jgi:hypothetical protein
MQATANLESVTIVLSQCMHDDQAMHADTLTTDRVRSAAKKKYKELLGIKANLEADNKELVEKYAQKAQ